MSRKPGSIVRGISTPRRISASQRAGCRWRVSTADGAKGQGIARQDGRARLLTVTTEPIRIKGLSGPDEPRFELRTGPPLIMVVGSGWQEWQGSNLRPPVLEIERPRTSTSQRGLFHCVLQAVSQCLVPSGTNS